MTHEYNFSEHMLVSKKVILIIDYFTLFLSLFCWKHNILSLDSRNRKKHLSAENKNGTMTFSTAAYRVEIFDTSPGKAISNSFGGDNSSNRMTITHRFSHRNNIRNHIISLQLKSPPMFSNSSKTDLYFIGYTNTTRFPYVFINFT